MLCKYCGNPVSAGDRVCHMCGRSLVAPVEIRTAKEPQNKIMKRLPFAVFTFLLCVSIIFCMVIDQRALLYPQKYADPISQCFLQITSILPAAMTFLYCILCVRRRLRDIGKSPYYSLLVMLPVFGVFYIIYLCFKKSVPLQVCR